MKIVAALITLPLLMTFALMAVEGWPFLDALYVAVITLSTVGFRDFDPSSAGKIVIIFFLVVGLGLFLYSIAHFGEVLLQVQLRDLLLRRKMDAKIRSLENHIIVCGYGRMGRSLCGQLEAGRQPFVVVDRDPTAVDAARVDGVPAVQGDATDDKILEKVGIQQAKGLAAVLPSDADNLFVVVSAHLARPELVVLARATEDRNVNKLQRAGANRVVSPYETGAHKMAQLLTSPNLEDVMGIFTRHGDKFDVAEVVVRSSSAYCGMQLQNTGLRNKGILIVGHQKPGGEFAVPPSPDALFEAGDVLIAFGDAEAISEILVR